MLGIISYHIVLHCAVSIYILPYHQVLPTESNLWSSCVTCFQTIFITQLQLIQICTVSVHLLAEWEHIHFMPVLASPLLLVSGLLFSRLSKDFILNLQILTGWGYYTEPWAQCTSCFCMSMTSEVVDLSLHSNIIAAERPLPSKSLLQTQLFTSAFNTNQA